MKLVPLFSANHLKKQLPLEKEGQKFIDKTRKEIKAILDGKSSKMILIVGPCSIHDPKSAIEYAHYLSKLKEQVEDRFLLIMRVYFEKPRTALGWKGFLYDPYLDGSNNIYDGLLLTREFLLRLCELQVPAATEFLDPLTALYFSDLISWGCIGARTVTSQPHRQLASLLEMPMAFKNSVDGNIDSAINGILSASLPHTYIGCDGEGQLGIIQTVGNLHAHVVLRGGKEGPNYDPQAISYTLERLHNCKIPLRLLIDCSHDNSFRRYEEQATVFQSALHQVVEGNAYIKGLLLESNLYAGNQPFVSNPALLKYGTSVTDPCLDWETTERLILWGHHFLQKETQLTESKKTFFL